MRLDRYTISLLLRGPEPPLLDEAAASNLQDDHMAHLADLYESGELLAAGPVIGPPDQRIRGLSILRVDPVAARALEQRDPALRAGLYVVETYPWLVPAGTISFPPDGRLPRSMADVDRPATE
jgi:uncharacterized protein YciI